MKRLPSRTWAGIHWRHLVLGAVVAGSLALVASLPPFGQDARYHDFADRRALFGIPNFFDVTSNLSFLLVGMAGLGICLRKGAGGLRSAWVVLFAGVTLVGFGSAWYHWDPGDETLFWDRLPMTIGFMGLFAVLLGEYVDERLGRWLLVPAVFLGCASVAYWRWSDDLRWYAWVQLLPFLTLPVLMALYRARYSHRWLLLAALGWYALGKLAEANDGEIWAFSRGLVSGHTAKHLLAALACLSLVMMLQRRKPLDS